MTEKKSNKEFLTIDEIRKMAQTQPSIPAEVVNGLLDELQLTRKEILETLPPLQEMQKRFGEVAAENITLQARLTALEKQEPVAVMLRGRLLSYKKNTVPEDCELYLAPVAQPAEPVCANKEPAMLELPEPFRKQGQQLCNDGNTTVFFDAYTTCQMLEAYQQGLAAQQTAEPKKLNWTPVVKCYEAGVPTWDALRDAILEMLNTAQQPAEPADKDLLRS